MKNKAFTLAEVLIALTIIGVIATITVPALVQRTNKQEYVSALQKAYSTLSQAANMIIAENGSPEADENGETWLKDNESLYNMFKKYLNNSQECSSDYEKCNVQSYTRFYGGKEHVNNSLMQSSGLKRLITADGMLITFTADSPGQCRMGAGNWDTGSKNVCALITVDINGAKKPNKINSDLFGFVLKKDGVYPAGCDEEGHCSRTRHTWNFGCTCKVIKEGAMNY